MFRPACEPRALKAMLSGALSLTLLVAAPTPAPAGDKPITEDEPIKDAVRQPLEDLSIVKDKFPPVIREAGAKPYDLSEIDGCADLEASISELDKLLGPDVDAQTPEDRLKADTLLGSAIRNAIDLPFRGVVRTLTGAEKREKKRSQAIAAAMARRAYLKGVAHGRRCGMPPPLITEAAAEPKAKDAAAQGLLVPPPQVTPITRPAPAGAPAIEPPPLIPPSATAAPGGAP